MTTASGAAAIMCVAHGGLADAAATSTASMAAVAMRTNATPMAAADRRDASVGSTANATSTTATNITTTTTTIAPTTVVEEDNTTLDEDADDGTTIVVYGDGATADARGYYYDCLRFCQW